MGLAKKTLLAFQFTALWGATCLYAAELIPSLEALSASGRSIEYSTVRPEGKIVFLHSEKTAETLLSKSAPAVSIRSVRAKAVLLESKKESVQSKTSKNGTVFGFADPRGQLHFFSTKGGYLLVTAGKGSAPLSVNDWMGRVRIQELTK